MSKITILSETFMSAQEELQHLQESVEDLDIGLYSNFDAPAIFAPQPMVA
jgi:hypothetical protein